jgi:RES domain-containing protein
VSALYLALDELTALEECRQLSTLMPPGLIVSYTVKLATVIDFSHGYSADWDALWQEMSCDWRRLWFNERVEPPSWLLGDLALEAGASGILFP